MALKQQKSFSINNINLVNTKFSNLTWFILPLPFIFFALRNLRKTNPEFGSSFITRLDVFNILDSINESYIGNLSLKMIGSILPIISIFLFEALRNRNNLKESLLNSSLGKIKSSKGYKYADIWYYIFSHLGNLPIILFFLTLGSSYFNQGIADWFHKVYEKIIPLPSNSLSIIITFLIAILLADFMSYVRHRVEHHFPLLWDLHEFHHSATEMTILSNYRNVFLSDILVAPFVLPFNILAGLVINEYISRGNLIPLYIYLLDQIIHYSFLFLGHSSLKVIYPKPFSIFLLSPSLHWLHHSDNPKHYDKNFGSKYTFWDKFFGTYLDESHLKDLNGFGVKNSQYNKFNPFYCYAILPITKILKRISKGNIINA